MNMVGKKAEPFAVSWFFSVGGGGGCGPGESTAGTDLSDTSNFFPNSQGLRLSSYLAHTRPIIFHSSWTPWSKRFWFRFFCFISAGTTHGKFVEKC